MSNQPKQQLVRIQSEEKATPLSKNQKAFNRLTKRIGEQENELRLLEQTAQAARHRIQTDLVPLQNQYNGLRADMVRLFDQLLTNQKFTKPERKKLTYLTTEMAYELIQKGYDDLTEIHDRYDETGFEEAVAEEEKQSSTSLKLMAEMMLGVTFDPAEDWTDPDKVKAHIAEHMRKRAETEAERMEEQEAKRAAKPKTEKQQAREAKKQAEAQNTTKAVRALYMDLVKVFHPDREPDEAEKTRKTAIMQRVTEAYEKSDLLGLFRLQLEFERIDQAHLEKLADSQLVYYNKILKQQVDELDEQLFVAEREVLSLFGGGPRFGFVSPVGVEMAISRDIQSLKKELKMLKADLKLFAANLDAVKAFLKTVRVAKAPTGPPPGFGFR